MVDERKDFILKTTGNYYGINDLDAFNIDKSIEEFLDNIDCLTLIIKKHDGRSELEFSNEITQPPTSTEDDTKHSNMLIYYKVCPAVITTSNIHEVISFTTVIGSPLNGFYHSLNRIFAPALLQSDNESVGPKMQSLLTDLESSLRSAVFKSAEDRTNLSQVSNVGDEFKFWTSVVELGKRKSDREKAKYFVQILKPLCKAVEDGESTDLDDISELAYNTIDDLWKADDYRFPQTRMENLMEIIGRTLSSLVIARLKSIDLWRGTFMDVEEILLQGISCCSKWPEMCERLTSLFWPHHSLYPWTGQPFRPDYISKFAERLKDIHKVRTVHRQITRLLSTSEISDFKLDSCFKNFMEMNVLNLSPYNEVTWGNAAKHFENSIKPAEEHVAGKILQHFQTINVNTMQLLQEFRKYQELIERPLVRSLLTPQRECLLGLLQDHIAKLNADGFDDKCNWSINYDMSPLVKKIYWLHQQESQIGQVEKTISFVLKDLNGYNELEEGVREVRKQLKDAISELLDSWTREVGSAIAGKRLGLRTSEPVVQFEQGKLMKVNYNPQLVALVKDVRQISVLGYSVPANIVETSVMAKSFINQARSLQQVATFHNTIGDRMIVSQRPMMLAAAVELARLVREQHSVTWKNTSAVDSYIKKLQSAVERLYKENTQLVTHHNKINNIVMGLMDTDLLRQQQKWKEGLREIREIMSRVEEDFTNSKSWRSHWDHQIYKALEYRYRVGLERLNEHLPEIRTDLVYRQQQLTFSPPIEDIRMKYYRQLKHFLAIPLSLRGVSDTNIFPSIIDNNAHRFVRVFEKAKDLFTRVLSVCDEWQDWVALGSVDWDVLIEQNLLTADDWALNFRASKALGQQIAKLSSSERKVDCIVISVSPVRAEVEMHNRKYWDILSSSLHSSVIQDVNKLENFIMESKSSLEKAPQSLQEVGEINSKFETISESAKNMFTLIESADKKNKILASWTKENVDDVSRMSMLWENFQGLLSNQQYIISKQVDMMKSNLVADAERLQSEIERFSLRWEQMKPREDNFHEGQRVMTLLKEKREKWDELTQSVKTMTEDFTRFGIKDDLPDFPQIEEVEQDLKHHESTWALYSEFTNELTQMGNEEWIVFRGKCQSQVDKFITKWSSRITEKPASSVSVYLMQELDSIKEMLPIVKFVRGEMFSDKHWMEMFNLLGLQYMPPEQITFNDILRSKGNIIKNNSPLQDLNSRAASEIVIRQALSDLDIWEVEAKFTMIPHTDCHGEVIHLIKDFNDVMTRVGDNQCLLQSIKSSPNFDDFIDRARIWETRLSDLDNNLRMLNQVQRKWIYLEPIFGAGTLKVESSRFERVDKDLRIILNDLFRGDHRVINLCKMSNLSNTLNSACQHLTVCQKNLLQFLEEKRNKFPRFYFIGDEDLLEILGQSQKRHVIQAHLKKLFSGIHSVKFDNENRIVAMCSLQGETVPLENPVILTVNVEEWLAELALEMTKTLRKLVQNCLESPDPLLYPSQVLCLAERVSFTKRCEESIKKKHLDALLKSLQAQLEAYTRQQNEWRVMSSAKDDENNLGVLELKLKSLLIDTIYHKDIVIELLEANVTDIEDWNWQRRLRFYLNRTGEVIVKMVDVEFTYSHEYQGNAARLVHTPLTDKCYLTLTQAMSAGLGGNPYGPAGTGKTESVKALGMLLGRQVLVFNCDEGIDAQSMTRILIGLVKCGSWGCFDEFNRLDETTLSAISIQIHTIQEALRKKSRTVSLLEQGVNVDHKTGIFVTMNPAGRGYGGRQQLPDNLKQLFRPVVMSKPDDTIIAQTILHCEGFKQAEEIGCKLVTLFSMAKKLLSEQQHYDWGLRALKTVVAGCGNALREYFTEKNEINDENMEMKLAVRVVRLNTLSKLTFSDSRKFDMLIKDTFPSVEFELFAHAKLTEAVESVYEEFNLTPNKWQVRKCTELYEQLIQRMGVVVVGPPGSGKSTVIKLLKNALKKMNVNVKQSVINPKAMNRAQLLGQTDPDTRQWIDGVLSSTSQIAYNVPSDVQYWIVFDGDVDPEWIESLNSVLDDNRLLTLPSGWRIQFGPNVHFLFETDSVQHASPATISRMGVILLSEEDLDTKSLVESWLKTQPENDQPTLSNFITDYLYKCVEWVLNENHSRIGEIKAISVVKNGLSRLTGATSRAKFAYGLAAGLGALLSPTFRESFYKFVFESAGELIASMDLSDSLIQHCYYDERRDCIDIYSTLVNSTSTNFNNKITKTSSLVLTGQVQACIDTILDWLQMKHPLILYAPPGTGKSILLDHCFSKLHNYKVATIHCSANITPYHLLQKLSQLCIIVSSSTGRVYRPKSSEYLILHFKDINRIQPDKWGTCMLIQFLQQFLSYKGFYDSNLEWVAFENIQIVCSVSSLESISQRFLSMNRIYCLASPEKNELQAIYTSYIKSLLGSNTKSSTIATAMINIYEAIKVTFNNNLSNPHYIFTPRDLTRWCMGLLRYPLKEQSNQCTIEALLYEAERRFKQRLVSDEDRNKYDNIISTVLDSDWSVLQASSGGDKIVFICDSQNGVSMNTFTRLDLKDWEVLVRQEVARLGLVDIVILPELSKLVASIEQSLSNPGESLMLVGQAGFGRKTALKIAASRLNATLVSPKIGPKYSISNFKNDLKKVMQTAGIDGEQVHLLLEDHQLIQSEFMDMVNSLLSSSEIPGLYHADELESLTGAISDLAEQDNFEGTTVEYFTKRVGENLHVVLLLDSTGPKFSEQLTSNPAMLKNCHIIWLDEWCVESFKLIPNVMIGEENELISDELVEMFVELHKQACGSSVLRRNICPKQYFSLVMMYDKLATEYNNSIQQRKERLQAGISKLSDAKNVVARLKLEAAEQEKLLGEKQEKATRALEMITETMSNTNTQRGQMEILKAQTEEESDALMARKAEIEAELQEIEPLIREACAAVGNIKSEALSEIRSLRAPPDVIRDILEGVLRLMGIQDTSWNSMKTFLAKRGVKEDIRCFDAHKITPESRESVEQMLVERRDSFNAKTAKRASVAAAPLAAWVTANVKYSKVLEKIRPLEREQAKLEKNLKSSEDRIVKLSSGLQDVDQTVAELKVKLNTFTKEAAEIEIHLNKAHETISAAEVLVSKLDDEYSRWKLQLNELSENLEKLPANSLLAAASIVYLSATSQDARSGLLDIWGRILGLKNFSLVTFLGKESEMIQWQSEGLPSDQLSIENALVVMNSQSCPLIVDPTCQAQNWLEKRVYKLREGKPTAVEIVSYSSPRLFTVLEFAIRFGKILVVNEVVKIDPFLYPILRGDFTYQGPRKMVQLGDKNVDYNPDFRLFLTTRTADCHISPDALAYVTKVNFMTSSAGLAQQLLACALNTEQPELEIRRKELLHQEEKLKLELDGMQERVLNRLASSDGDILENKELLNSLNEAKRSSVMIQESLEEFMKLQSELKEHCNVYQPLAEYASYLYFAIASLPALNSIYCISVNAFLRLFQTSLKSSKDIESNEKCSHLLHLVYYHVSRSLFRSDHLTFGLHLAHSMNPKLFKPNEWELFTRQSNISEFKVDVGNESVPKWIDQDRMYDVHLFHSTLPDLYNSLRLEEEKIWKGFPRSTTMKPPVNLSLFQEVLLVQALSPDYLCTSLVEFTCKALGLNTLSAPPLSLNELFKDSVAEEPIMIISGQGSDPSSELRYLVETVSPVNCYEVALGEGQEREVLRLLKLAAVDGSWLILKNVHLMTGWLAELEAEYRLLTDLNKNFRLWLTTQPHNSFPSLLISQCLKVTYEAPPGVKRNMQRTYGTWEQDTVLQTSIPGPLFNLAWFHALVLERRTIIPQGWVKFYEFNETDLSAALQIMKTVLEKAGSSKSGVNWQFFKGLCEGAVYGGRVDNTYDLRVLSAYLDKFFTNNRTTSLNLGIDLPQTNNIREHIRTIDKIQDVDSPTWFGLPANVDRSWQRNTSTHVISQLQLLSSEVLDPSLTNDWHHHQLNPVLNLWKKLNQGVPLLKMKEPSLKTDDEHQDETTDPLQSFVNSEFRFALELVHHIHSGLASITRVLKNSSQPTTRVNSLAQALAKHQVPDEWESLWRCSTVNDSMRYLRSVMTRAMAVHSMLSHKNVTLTSLDLADIFHPETLLNALRQQTARSLKGVSIDDLHLKCSWSPVTSTKEINSRVDQPQLTILGLQLEGAQFDSHSLSANTADSPDVTVAPPLSISWCKKALVNDEEDNNILRVPLYSSVDRENLITELTVPCNPAEKQKWILASVAFHIRN